MDKIVFIVPYYGKFPGYFREWAYTAGYLKEQNIDFLLITDIEINFKLPRNINVINLSFQELVKKAQAKFDFKLGLTTPYKLCDFKAALGYVFENEIKEYAFWGNCDIDQIWGDVRAFITQEILDKYDRIQFLGHFILYRNCSKINKMFMMSGAIYDYKKVFSDTMHYSFCEHSGMMKIAVENNILNYLKINYADLSPRYTRMIISRQPNYKYQILFWEKGKVYRKYIDQNGQIGSDEYMYFHFQRKNPKTLPCWREGSAPNRIIYRADGFIEGNIEEINKDYIYKYADFKSISVDKRESHDYILKKLISFIKSPLKKKILWIKQKNATKKLVKREDYFDKNYSNI